jgi:hypothetical protein
MSNPSTPPRPRDASNGRFSSKPTPLKHDRLGSQAHSSGPLPKASTLYMEMTREACDKFVGPMPVDQFLSEFVPETTKKRPCNRIRFSHSSVSRKEEAFVCHRILSVIDAHEYYRSMHWKHLDSVPNSDLWIPLLVKIVQKRNRDQTSPFIGSPTTTRVMTSGAWTLRRSTCGSRTRTKMVTYSAHLRR